MHNTYIELPFDKLKLFEIQTLAVGKDYYLKMNM